MRLTIITHSIMFSAPAIVLSQSEATVESKVRRTQRLFCRSKALGGVDICDQLPRRSRPKSTNKNKNSTNKPPPVDFANDEYNSVKWKENDPLAAEKERELNVSRIVFGNIDMFIDKYPFFVHRLNVWIEVSNLKPLTRKPQINILSLFNKGL